MIAVLTATIRGRSSITGACVRIRASQFSRTAGICLAASLLTIGLAGCGSNNWGFPYRATVQQGNWITSEQVAQLEVGMTRDQVRFILGTPTLEDIFHAERWDYPYYNQPGYGKDELRKFTVWFENDRLTRWSGDEQPDRQPFQKNDSGKEAVQSADKARADDAAQQAASPGTNDAAAPNASISTDTPQATIETGVGNTKKGQ
ncbi:outer membrane protein assembly factor BamE [Castellaniella caeni]